MTDRGEPADVQAAKRGLGKPMGSRLLDLTDQPEGLSVNRGAPADLAGDAALALLADRILDARNVQIVGTMPPVFARLLVERARDGKGSSRLQAAQLHCLVSAPAHLRNGNGGRFLGEDSRRWTNSIKAMANLLDLLGGEAALRDQIHMADTPITGCLFVLAGSAPQPECVSLTSLPALADGPGAHPAIEPLVVLTAGPGEAAQISAAVDAVAAVASPLRLMEFLCRAESAAGTAEPGHSAGAEPDEEFRPLVASLSQYGLPRPPGLILAATAVVVTVRTATGKHALLKRRDVWNARDSFGALALISDGVLEQDLARHLEVAVEESARPLDHWWIRLQSPDEFVLPRAVFIKAAQRELHMSCGLDIDDDRFHYCGSHVVHKETGGRLGFCIFEVQLQRDERMDELSAAMIWGNDLELIRVDELYGEVFRPQLNRLLATRQRFFENHLRSVIGK